MKKFKSRKFLIIVFILLVAFSCTVFAYAGGGDDEKKEDPIVGGSSVEASGNISSRYTGADIRTTELEYTYILAVSTGAAKGEVEKIEIVYQNSTGSIITQMLDPDDGEIELVGAASEAYDTASYQKDVSGSVLTQYFHYLSVINTSGSRYASYYNLLNRQPYFDNTYDSAASMVEIYHTYQFLLYDDYVSSLCANDSDTLSDYSIENVLLEGETFKSYTTEYIRFKTEYAVKSIIEVNYILKSEKSTGAWSLNGWRLYKVHELKESAYTTTEKAITSKKTETIYNYAVDVYPLKSVTFDGVRYYDNAPSISRFSFLSDRVSMIINKDWTLIAKSNDEELKKVGQVGYTDNIGVISFIYNGTVRTNNGYTYNFSNGYIGKTEETYNLIQCNVSQTESVETFNFEIKFSDEANAGIDSFYNITDSDISYEEVLYAEIAYINSFGYEEHVTIPVVSNALLDACISETESSTLTSDSSKKVLAGAIATYAQEGDSLCFPVELANYSELKSITLKFNNPTNTSDYIMIDSITVYEDDSEMVRADYLAKEDYIETIASGDVLYKTPNDSNNRNVYLDNISDEATFDLVRPETIVESVESYDNIYLVTLNTSNVQTAGTLSDVYVQFYYMNADGNEVTTTEALISTLAKDYYGYCPSEVIDSSSSKYDWFSSYSYMKNNNGKTVTKTVCNSYYPYGMRQGGTISFYITANNLERFTQVKFRVENTDDNWQLQGLTIQTVESIGKRKAVDLTSKVTIGNIEIYRTFERSIEGEVLYSTDKANLLLVNSDTKTLNLDEASVSGDITIRDYREYYYSMSYELACSNLRILQTAKNYEIRVNVAGNNTDGTSSDDTGSCNLFYFQLEFENGSSGYVLANQQLLADGFRAGKTEVFYISCNEDYGNLVAINILPDDVTDDSSKLDKLCIDTIDVIKHNVGSVNKQFSTGKIGWVNVEYRDEDGTDGASGRYEEDLVTTAQIESSGFLLQLEFSLTYDSYPKHQVTKKDDNGKDVVVTESYPQFVGSMLCDIVYYNSNNEEKTLEDVDIVKLMYEYDNNMSATLSTDKKTYISDKDWMFREGTTDRFYIDISDASSIKEIKLKGNPQSETYLNIKQITVKLTRSTGNVSINTNNEYECSYETEPLILVDSVTRSLPKAFEFAANKTTNYVFVFKENELPELEEETTLTSDVSRVPTSATDSLNVYIFMKEGAIPPSATDKSLTASVYYKSASTSKSYVTQTSRLKEALVDDRTVLYYQGLSATNMSTITNMNIKVDSTYKNALIDYAVVQQVRAGTIVETYIVKFTGSDPSVKYGISLATISGSSSIGDQETAQLLFAGGTTTKQLNAEEYDVAVSFKYTSKLDSMVGATKTVYQSPYVYLTDNGTVQVSSGLLGEFNFNIPYVDEIEGLVVAGVNGFTTEIEGATLIKLEKDSDGNLVQTEYYSFGEVANISGTSTLGATSKEINTEALIPAVFEFTTMDNSTVIDSNGEKPISVTISYTNTLGVTLSKTITDITKYASVGSSFASGKTATITTFLKGANRINSITINPSTTEQASWNLGTITYTLNGSTRNVNVNETIYYDEPTAINLSDITVKLTINDGNNTQIVRNKTYSMEASSGDSLTIGVEVSGSFAGLSYKYGVTCKDGSTETEIAAPVRSEDTTIAYKIPSDAKSGSIYYITFTSEENESVKSVIAVKVK